MTGGAGCGAAAVGRAGAASGRRRRSSRRGGVKPGRHRRRPTAISYKNGGDETCVETRLRDDDRGQGRARRAHRRRQHRRARSGGHERRLRRPAERRRRRAARRLLHARPEEARRRRRRARRRAHAVARRADGDGRDRPSPDRRRRTRRGSRATWASRSRTTSTPSARARPGSSGSAAPIRCTTSIRSSARRRCAQVELRDDGRGADRSATTSTARSTATASTPKGEICGVTTTSGLAWKIPGRVGDSPILGAGLYVDGDVGAAGSTGPRRGQPLQPLLLPDRRGDAPRHAPEGRRHGGAASGSRPTRSRSGC